MKTAQTGPAFPQLLAQGPVDWGVWSLEAAAMERELPVTPGRDRRVHHLYLPVLFWLARRVDQAARRPLVVGLNAPQGAGKTTLVRTLMPHLARLGIRAAALSADDLYLTHAEQQSLAAANPENPYLRYRGYPGTHDVALGAETLAALRGLGATGEARLPAYEKSLYGGRGDRLPRERWPTVRGPLDLVVIEGWMLGFRPVEAERLADPSLRLVNEKLASYGSWLRLIDDWIVLRSDAVHVLRWRVEAEEAMKASGRPGLDRAAIEDYTRRFLPAYATYATAVAEIAAPDRRLVIDLDSERLPVGSAPARI